MAYASRSGRARTSPSNPQAFGVCDRCGMWYNFVDLQWQYDWRGATLQNLRILVCNPCYDTPQEQLRAIVVPADPTPILNARVEQYVSDEVDYRTTSGQTTTDPTTGIPIPGNTVRITQDGSTRTTQPLGPPTGLTQSAQMPLNGTTAYGVSLPLVSVTSVGANTVSVTCSSPHGLSNNSQISAEGLSNNQADGFYSVTVTTATAFTYMTNRSIPLGPLLTPTSRIITALVGLPYNYDQIPQTGD
jgi:hypothetical protein